MINEALFVHQLLLYILFILFALAVGSFLNVVIYRLPIMLKLEWTSECRHLLQLPEEKNERINLFFPRSFCRACHCKIPFWHNIPVLSYLILRGRCKQCKKPVSPLYPAVEVLTLLLSLFAAWYFGFSIHLIFVLLFTWLLIVLTFIDIQHQLLPDSLTLSLLWLGLIANTQTLFTPLANAVLSAVGAYLFLWLFIHLFKLLTGKIGMGHGDFKLFAAFGAWFGWMQLPFILLASSLLGSIVGMVYLISAKKKKETPIPFGPFLCFSGLVSLFFGDTILRWYLSFYY